VGDGLQRRSREDGGCKRKQPTPRRTAPRPFGCGQQQAIARACKSFKALQGKKYPITEEELAKRLPTAEVPPPTPINIPAAADDAESSLSTGEGATPATEGDGAPAPAVSVPEKPPTSDGTQKPSPGLTYSHMGI
jgi:hypothetical protein